MERVMPPTKLEREFHEQVLKDIELVKARGVIPTRFISMVQGDREGAVGAAHKLLASPRWHEGFLRIWAMGLGEQCTVEFRCLQPKWAELFSEHERDVARRRIAEMRKRYRHPPSSDAGS
jgi:hypothetical protein